MEIPLLLLLLSTSCAHYTSKSEYREYAKKEIAHTNFTLPKTSLKEARRRLIDFSKVCLGYVISEVEIANAGMRRSQFDKTYTPSIDEKDGLVSMYVMYTLEGSFNSKSSAYVFLAELKAPNGKDTEGVTYFHDSIFKDTSDISKYLIYWLKDEKKLCPPLL